ncbi:hypothetical protein [Mycolicibacterium sp. CBMA 361]|uniref:hypothetical protein n=2 Tax=Mycolicibacterium TaxID=1866885 RepID=UPI001396946E|nr:hypothetical protein [Mycolicibacterium sp. CBMA 361]MUM07951.1 hypothetical protein [Mycolicibacterium sp. CBMA 213]MUM31473.1 hypothetical protein [Mycolicibacterium sp. CBMA 361]
MLNHFVGRCITVNAIALAAGSIGMAVAGAQPALPFIPGPPGIAQPGAPGYGLGTGSFTYSQHPTDTRGVRTGGVTADPSQTSVGLPNSKPGAASPNQYFWQTYANARYGIQGGIVAPDTTQAIAQSDTGVLPGMVSSGGPTPESALESPDGTAPKTGVPKQEVTNPTPPTYAQLEPPSAQQAQPAQ